MASPPLAVLRRYADEILLFRTEDEARSCCCPDFEHPERCLRCWRAVYGGAGLTASCGKCVRAVATEIREGRFRSALELAGGMPA